MWKKLPDLRVEKKRRILSRLWLSTVVSVPKLFFLRPTPQISGVKSSPPDLGGEGFYSGGVSWPSNPCCFRFPHFFHLVVSLFFCAFCSLFQGFQGFCREENPCFFGGSSLFLPKKQGSEGQDISIFFTVIGSDRDDERLRRSRQPRTSLSMSVQALQLSRNKLSGSLPDTWGSLQLRSAKMRVTNSDMRTWKRAILPPPKKLK